MLFVYCIVAISFASEYFVSTSGSDENDGSMASPFKTISRALDQVAQNDQIWLSEGTYEVEKLIIDGINKVKISAIPNQEVILDGTRQIETTWHSLEEDPRIWTTNPEFPVWQLFAEGSMIGLARFPNAEPWSESAWDRFQWREQAPGSSDGVMKDLVKDCDDEAQTLAGLDRSLNGCVATLNVGHWVSVSSVISGHEAGSDTFNYVNDRDWWFSDGHYMVECLAALDSPGEWAYDWDSNTLYFWPENGVNPNDVEMRGKTNDYLLFVSNAEKFQISDVTFFGGGLKFNNVIKSTVENIIFDHPSYNKRALGRAERAPSALFITRPFQSKDIPSKNVIRGCTFKYTDGAALEIERGFGDSIDHNSFSNIDYSAAYATGAVDFLSSQNTRFRWNSIDTTGSSETVRVGTQSTIKLNVFRNGGLLQEDGAAVQVPIKSQENTLIYRNWAIDNGKLGFRFDTPHLNGEMGERGTMRENVAFNNRRGLSVKADKHTIEDNTAVMNSWYGKNDIIVYVDNLGQSQWQYNLETVTTGNFAGTISGTSEGMTDLNNPGDNFSSATAVNLLRDPLHGDFRPRERTQYGAYKIPRGKNYWIPGPREVQRSARGLPENLAVDVPADVDLKWQICREECVYDVYFGTDSLDLEQIASGIDYNVVRLSTDLEVGLTYYWRVDTQHGEGDLWQFTVGSDFVFDPENSCTDLELIQSEINDIRIALNQNGWTNWCDKTGVRDAFEETSFLQNYENNECTDAQCARERMQNPVCDLEFVSRHVMGRSAWLGHIAADLNKPHCFGSCNLSDDNASTEVVLDMPVNDVSWTECNFPILYAEVSALHQTITRNGAWQEVCSNNDVRETFMTTILLAGSTCSDQEIHQTSTLILNEWFSGLVDEIRECYGN